MINKEIICENCGAYMSKVDENTYVCDYCNSKLIINDTEQIKIKPKKIKEHSVESKNKERKIKKTALYKNLSTLNALQSLGLTGLNYLITSVFMSVPIMTMKIIKTGAINDKFVWIFLLPVSIIICFLVIGLIIPQLIVMMISIRRFTNSKIRRVSRRINLLTCTLSIIYVIADIMTLVMMLVLMII